MRKAIYAGTFDPLTLGHLDLIERAAEIFDEVILAVAVQTAKQTLFDVEDRVAFTREAVQHIANVQVDSFDGLLVEFARSQGVSVLIRGIRAYSDFESEFQMALTNRKLAPEIETLFMMPKENHSYVSSSTVKQVARAGGDIACFVPPSVQRALTAKLGLKPRGGKAT